MKKNSDWKAIAGGIVLIAVLFAGIKFIFWGLGEVIQQDIPDVSQSASAAQDASAGQSGQTEGPSFCVHCGGRLPEGFQWGQFCPWCGEKADWDEK